VEDDGIGDKELLVAYSNKRCGKICGWMQYVSENEKSNRSSSREVDGE